MQESYLKDQNDFTHFAHTHIHPYTEWNVQMHSQNKTVMPGICTRNSVDP